MIGLTAKARQTIQADLQQAKPSQGKTPSLASKTRGRILLKTFDIQLLRAAYRQPYRDDFTDDASVVEAYGHPVTLVEGNRENIKITTPYDLTIAEVLV